MKKEKPNAATIEVLNQKLNVIVNNQLAIEKKIDNNFKIIMQRINKVQEFNEIADMRYVVTNKELKRIINQIQKNTC